MKTYTTFAAALALAAFGASAANADTTSDRVTECRNTLEREAAQAGMDGRASLERYRNRQIKMSIRTDSGKITATCHFRGSELVETSWPKDIEAPRATTAQP